MLSLMWSADISIFWGSTRDFMWFFFFFCTFSIFFGYTCFEYLSVAQLPTGIFEAEIIFFTHSKGLVVMQLDKKFYWGQNRTWWGFFLYFFQNAASKNTYESTFISNLKKTSSQTCVIGKWMFGVGQGMILKQDT